MKIENTKIQMRKGILEYCILLILEQKEGYWQNYYKVYDKNGLNTFITKGSENQRSFSDFVKTYSFKKGEFTTHEIRYAGFDLKVMLEFKSPDIENNYLGDFLIKEIIQDKYCIKWALSPRFKNGLQKEINRKYKHL